MNITWPSGDNMTWPSGDNAVWNESTVFGGAQRGGARVWNLRSGAQRADARVGYAEFGGAQRAAAVVRAVFAGAQRGAALVLLACGGRLAARGRVANDHDEFRLYHAIDDADFDFSSPEATNDTGVFPVTPSAGHTHRYVCRRMNPYGLEAANVEEYSVEIDAAGDPVAVRPSAALDVAAEATAGGTVTVTAGYAYLPDGVNAGDTWLVYVTTDGADPDPATDTPATASVVRADGLAKLSYTTAALADGTEVRAVVSLRRNDGTDAAPDYVEGAASAVVSATADATPPAAPDGTAFFGARAAAFDEA